MEPTEQLYTIRQPSKADIPAITAFCNAHNLLGTQWHDLQTAQWIQSSWLCEKNNGELAGVLTTSASPSAYSTAILNDLAISDPSQAIIARLLLQACCHYWSQQCIRNLAGSSKLQSHHAIGSTFADMGFTTDQIEGISIIKKILNPERICLHNKKMRPTMNTANGQVNEETLFEYFQHGDYVWGTYGGGAVARGVLLGKMNANRDMRFYYFQLDHEGNLHQGNSRTSTEFLNDGRVVLYENWQWTGSKTGSGNSIIEEIK
jgi:N-acetylglutamate synthase-like GNAT family acetyltransferase